MRYKVFLFNVYSKTTQYANFVKKNTLKTVNKTIFRFVEKDFFFKKKIKINFIKNLNFLKKNFFLKNSTILFKFSLNLNKGYKITRYHINQFNFSKQVQKTFSQTMTNLFWNFFIKDFEFFVKYLFNKTPIKNHRQVFMFLQKCFLNVGFNYSTKLIYISINFKGKLSNVGCARKRHLFLKKGPFYKKITPRKSLITHLTSKIHYFFIYTVTGVTSVVTIIKHIR